MTFETYDQSDYDTWPDQPNDNDSNSDKDKYKYKYRDHDTDMTRCVKMFTFQTIKSDTGQHSQFLRCLFSNKFEQKLNHQISKTVKWNDTSTLADKEVRSNNQMWKTLRLDHRAKSANSYNLFKEFRKFWLTTNASASAMIMMSDGWMNLERRE